MRKIRHVLGISGGKDSAALAIYLKQNYPELNIEYYFCDTGEELPETYNVIDKLESYLGKKITKLSAPKGDHESPFRYWLSFHNNYLPSATARWCTKKMKLEPFEKFIGDDLVISYVAIREDENREGYISKKENIQTIFPFRKNIWSEDVTNKVLSNKNIPILMEIVEKLDARDKRIIDMIKTKITPIEFTLRNKLNLLLGYNVKFFNKIVFEYLKHTDYPLSYLDDFSLLNKDDYVVLDGVYNILRSSGVGIPSYYDPKEYTVVDNSEELKGTYNRSRSGCYFCFFQQKIEWVWLLENHPDLYKKAMEFEKDGFTWNQGESLEELSKPERVIEIKINHIKKCKKRMGKNNSNNLLEILEPFMGDSCPACFL